MTKMPTNLELLNEFVIWRRELDSGLNQLQQELQSGNYTGAAQIMLTLTKNVISTSIAGIDSINGMTEAAIHEHSSEARRPVL